MSWKHLGESFDIHGGGHDLIFPHHENEVAQSVCAFPGAAFARYWMHNGMLLVDGEKMSKSLGNFLTVRDILKKGPWAGEAFRLLLLRTHYRQSLDFTAAGLDEAKAELDDHYAMLARAGAADADDESASMADWALEPLRDDLNTPLALARLRDLRTLANALTVGGSPNVVLERMGLRDAPEIGAVVAAFREAASVLGLEQSSPAQWLQGDGDDAAAIEAAIAARLAARQAKNWGKADRIRDELKAQGIILEDGAGGTGWKRA
jgi:cysteinyl-tRNA synthetase